MCGIWKPKTQLLNHFCLGHDWKDKITPKLKHVCLTSLPPKQGDRWIPRPLYSFIIFKQLLVIDNLTNYISQGGGCCFFDFALQFPNLDQPFLFLLLFFSIRTWKMFSNRSDGWEYPATCPRKWSLG
jgi:hypothetical protein